MGRPSIHISPTNVDIVGGQSHTITCSVQSISAITGVIWIKSTASSDTIVNVVGVDGKFSGGTLSDPSLTINNFAKSDEGIYVCRATNWFGTALSEDSLLTCKVHTFNQGRTNYARLGLVIVDIFQNIFREIMRSNIAPEALSILIKKKKNNNLSVFSKMTHDERVSLNTLTNRTYDNIDFTLSYKLMRSLPLIDDPTQGWGRQPTIADVTISDDVERLRIVRNKIVHRIKADIDLVEMNDYFSNIVNITQRIDTYLSKQQDQGFTRAVRNFQTHCMYSEMEQQYYQALKDIEDMKEKFSVENVHFYYGKTFSNLIQDVKNKAKSSVVTMSLVLDDINDDNIPRILNELKTEINSGLVNIEFKQAVSGSLVIYIDILDSNLLSTEHELGHQIYIFLCRALEPTGFNMKTENEITVVLIKEEDDIEVEFSIESDNWETYDEEISLRSNSLCLELDVNTEIFNTEQKMRSEFGLLVKSVLGSNGNSNIESVNARLEPGIVGKFFT